MLNSISNSLTPLHDIALPGRLTTRLAAARSLPALYEQLALRLEQLPGINQSVDAGRRVTGEIGTAGTGPGATYTHKAWLTTRTTLPTPPLPAPPSPSLSLPTSHRPWVSVGVVHGRPTNNAWCHLSTGLTRSNGCVRPRRLKCWMSLWGFNLPADNRILTKWGLHFEYRTLPPYGKPNGWGKTGFLPIRLAIPCSTHTRPTD